MFYGIAFTSMGIALIAKAIVSGGVWWACFWPGLCSLILGAAYFGLGAAVLGKRSDGSLPTWSVLSLAPYFMATWSVWHAARFLTRKPASHEIAPGLLLGRRPLAEDVPGRVRLIVDLTAEFPLARGVTNHAAYVTVPTLDASVPADEALAAVIERIAGSPEPVYLHCASGHGRSATVAAGVLLARGLAETPETAVRAVCDARPGANPNRVQRAALQRWWNARRSRTRIEE